MFLNFCRFFIPARPGGAYVPQHLAGNLPRSVVGAILRPVPGRFPSRENKVPGALPYSTKAPYPVRSTHPRRILYPTELFARITTILQFHTAPMPPASCLFPGMASLRTARKTVDPPGAHTAYFRHTHRPDKTYPAFMQHFPQNVASLLTPNISDGLQNTLGGF